MVNSLLRFKFVQRKQCYSLGKSQSSGSIGIKWFSPIAKTQPPDYDIP